MIFQIIVDQTAIDIGVFLVYSLTLLGAGFALGKGWVS